MPFEFFQLEISGVIRVKPVLYPDERGLFAEMYKREEFAQNGIAPDFVQINHSVSKAKVLRGLHYQISPKPQGKLITAITGKIFDVAVDLRKTSDTFGKWVSKELDAKNKELLYVPPGFAHGFAVLSDWAEVIYYCTEYYSPEHERGIAWNDEELAVRWPIDNPVVSQRDASLPKMADAENNFT